MLIPSHINRCARGIDPGTPFIRSWVLTLVTAAFLLGQGLFSLALAFDNPYLVKDIFATGLDSNVESIVEMNGVAFFSANDGTHGIELWRSDGTPQGTVMVKDIYPGEYGSIPWNLINVNGTLFFTAVGPDGSGLWKSDGTSEGTVFVKTASPQNVTSINGILFFSSFSCVA